MMSDGMQIPLPVSTIKIVIERRGMLKVNEQEGGYCSAQITIDGEDLERVIADALGVECFSDESPNWPMFESGFTQPLGRCHLKLEIERGV